ncbi:6-phosphogluconate dehydrogenase, decarboxylating-like [Chironomus tepperi]|uniref:6-phosphogluconate dehydrogenase, decarboxylating-like n=1 Tax=Chironomus tepperi TaxID=113505 RepID=UPI00391F74E4
MLKTMAQKADIALIGLAVMGQNLILNMDSKGFVVCAFNRTVDKVKHFLDNEAKGTKIIGATSMEDMVSKLKSPRRVMLLVKGEYTFLIYTNILFVVVSVRQSIIVLMNEKKC